MSVARCEMQRTFAVAFVLLLKLVFEIPHLLQRGEVRWSLVVLLESWIPSLCGISETDLPVDVSVEVLDGTSLDCGQ